MPCSGCCAVHMNLSDTVIGRLQHLWDYKMASRPIVLQMNNMRSWKCLWRLLRLQLNADTHYPNNQFVAIIQILAVLHARKAVSMGWRATKQDRF